MKSTKRVLLFSAVALMLLSGGVAEETIFDLFMPNAHRGQADDYMHVALPLPTDRTYYVVEFLPSASMEVVHHMEVDICTSTLKEGDNQVCSDKNIIYMWARNASKLSLPKGVGFMVGKETPYIYVGLTMHFASTPDINDPKTKKLGVLLRMTDDPQPKTAGVYLLLTGSGNIQPGAREHFDVQCQIKEDVEMHIFAYRTHTHTLGKVVSGYRVRTKHGDNFWTLIGKKDPMEPQMFYPVADGEEIIVKKGDILAGRCTMENSKNHVVSIGSTSEDEMCNFYSMYWVKKDHHPNNRYCFTSGPPNYYWETDPALSNIPTDSDTLTSNKFAM